MLLQHLRLEDKDVTAMFAVPRIKDFFDRLRSWALTASCAAVFIMVPFHAVHAQSDKNDEELAVPPTLQALESIKSSGRIVLSDDENEDILAKGGIKQIRIEAQREAAISYGARGGLAARTYEIRQTLEKNARYLDKVFNFNQLLIPAPSGLLIEPPIITEQQNAMIIEGGGQQAAVADRVYGIDANARIVGAARHWRNYLERDWGDVTPPPDLLRPTDKEERKEWVKRVREGWERGYAQADLIYETDLNQLLAHYRGMVRYRMLLAQGMVSQPFALHVDRGVTGGGSEMRIGDRSIEITDMPQLQTKAQSWHPANR